MLSTPFMSVSASWRRKPFHRAKTSPILSCQQSFPLLSHILLFYLFLSSFTALSPLSHPSPPPLLLHCPFLSHHVPPLSLPIQTIPERQLAACTKRISLSVTTTPCTNCPRMRTAHTAMSLGVWSESSLVDIEGGRKECHRQ